MTDYYIDMLCVYDIFAEAVVVVVAAAAAVQKADTAAVV
jgi:hypothetical protein